jgi:hypothetical protein
MTQEEIEFFSPYEEAMREYETKPAGVSMTPAELSERLRDNGFVTISDQPGGVLLINPTTQVSIIALRQTWEVLNAGRAVSGDYSGEWPTRMWESVKDLSR